MKRRIELKENTSALINDLGLQIKHPEKDRLCLSDIYVHPDLRVLAPIRGAAAALPGDEGVPSFVSSVGLPDAAETGAVTLICGPRDSGKTALLKILASRLLDSGMFALYIDAGGMGVPPVESLDEYFITKYSEQLTEESLGRVGLEGGDKRMLLLDNADRIAGRSEDRGVFLGKLTEHFRAVFLTAETPPEFTVLPEGFSVYGVPEGFAVYEIMELGLTLRRELISKWIDIGPREEDSGRVASRKAGLTAAVDAVLRRNIVPSYPVYILPTLQMADSDDQVTPSISSFGHYYEYLITKSLAGAAGREELGFYCDMLSSLAYRMFCRRSRWISGEDIRKLIEILSADSPSSPGSAEEIISALLSSDTLAEKESGYEFRYGYIYHYFSALHFSRTLDFQRMREEVKRLFANLDNEEYANIALFLTHLSNDAFVLDQIAHNVEYAESCEEPYQTEEEEAYLDELIKELVQLTDKERKLREMRTDYSHETGTAAKKPIGFRVLGTDIRTTKRKEKPRPGVSRKPLIIRALLRISSETLYCQPSEGPRKLPPGFEENVYELFGSSLRIKKREADRAKESAASVKGHIFENNGAVEDKLLFLLEIYGLYMRIYLSSMRQLSLLSEADSPGYTNTISDTLMRISAGIFRRDQAPSTDTVRKFIEENPDRGFARELIGECAALRLYIFGRESGYPEELLGLLNRARQADF